MWRQVIGPIAGLVLVWREPMAVARSLAERDGIPIDRGLDLWRRYNEDALDNAEGHDPLVVDYDDMLQDPTAVSASASAWLDDIVPGFVPDATRVLAAGGSVSPGLRHQRGGETLESGCDSLRERLTEMSGRRHRARRPPQSGGARPGH
jgi:hypothetical protein